MIERLDERRLTMADGPGEPPGEHALRPGAPLRPGLGDHGRAGGTPRGARFWA